MRSTAGARSVGILAAIFSLLIVGCAQQEETSEEATVDAPEETQESLTVYSGRNKSLIDPLLDMFTEKTGIPVDVRYGGTAEMAATLLEEGDRTPCDVFIGQDAGALGALAKAGLAKPIPQADLDRVPASFRSSEGLWVGLSGRARVVVYNSERIQPEELPQSLDEVIDPKYKGRFGVAPSNASFQAHMAVYRAVRGEEALDQLLAGLKANEAVPYPKNSAIVEAVLQGEVDFGLTNHYYLWRAKKEQPDAPGFNNFMQGDEVSSFINLAGAVLLQDQPAAQKLLTFLVSDEAQDYFAQQTFEYPVVEGVAPAAELNALPEMGEQLDFAQVADALEPTLEAINRSGLL